jgi:cell division protease FtsH
MEPSGTAGASPAQEVNPAGQQAPAGQAQSAAQPESQGGGSADSQADRTRRRLRQDQDTSPPPWRVEGLPGGKQGQGSRRTNWPRFLWFMLALLILNWLLASALAGAARPTLSYSFFLTQVNANNVQTVTSTGDSLQGTFRHQVAYPPATPSSQQAQVTGFTTERPTWANDNLEQKLQADGVTVTANPTGTPLWEDLLLWFGPALLFGLLLYGWMRSGMSGLGGLGGLGGMGGLGKSRAREYNPETAQRTTFADVAGIEDVKNEVMEIVDFLRNPGRYTRLGALIPHGVLLSGAPGTGKTLLARAVAGEANVPFFSSSASEFVEMIVGVGASRVRDLFDQAKQVAPAIIFIDEIDSIGRQRGGANSMGGNDEQEQTLDQILTEMDGFTGNEGVVVLAATNRADVLDPALLRPGRFDRRVTVSAPDQRGRQQILAVHTRGVPLASDVDLDAVAAQTPGMVGADLANLVNEAALLAARRNQDQVTMADFNVSLEKVELGTIRGIVLSPDERERTAYHESGHALLGMLTPGADPVRQISIIPRGQSLGATYQAPSSDRYDYTTAYLRGRITGALGGRASEEVIYGDVTTGAESDMDNASNIARQMVGRWGMSPAVGPVTVLPPPGQENPYGLDGVAPATRELVDTETRRIIEECYAQALETLRGNRDRLDRLARALLQKETLGEDEAYAAAGVSRDTASRTPTAVAGATAPAAVAGSPAPDSAGG